MDLTEVQKDDIQNNKDIAAFSYIWIFSVVILWTRRDSQFIQFHARQSVVLFVLSVLIYILGLATFDYIKYLNVFTVAGMITGFINANMGEYYEMPLVSDVVKHHITTDEIWDLVKKTGIYIVDFIKRIFKKGPRVIVEWSVDAVSKIRGVDVLKVNAKVADLENIVQNLNVEKRAMQLQMANLEVSSLVSWYLQNLNFLDTPQNIQSLVNEIIKQINLKNLGFSQEDYQQYILFKNKEELPVVLIGNFSPDKFYLFISNSNLKTTKDYIINFNSWHWMEIKEISKDVKRILAELK